MKTKTTVVLAVCLLICTVYVIVRHTDVFKPPQPLVGPKVIFPSPPGEIKRLTITSADGSKIAFAKQDDTWRIVEPVQAKADSAAVTTLTGAVAQLHYTRRIKKSDKDARPSITGLDKPLWNLTLLDEGDEAFAVDIGNPAPLASGRTYVREVKSGHLYEVAFDFHARLGRPLHEFRDKRLFDANMDRVVRFAVYGGPKALELTKVDEQWRLVQPVSASADSNKVNSLLRKLLWAKVSEFVDDRPESLGPYDLDQPHLIARVWLDASEPPATAPATASAPADKIEPHSLALGRRAGDEVYAKLLAHPSIFTVAGSLMKDLQPEIMDLRDRKLLDVETQEITRVEMTLPDGKAVLAKEDGRWQMIEPFAGPANAEQVEELLEAIESLEAESFQDDVDPIRLAEFSLDSPRARITLHRKDAEKALQLLVGGESPSGEMTFVQAPAEQTTAPVAVIPSAKAKPLLEPSAAYWDTTLLELGADEKITRVAITRKDGGYVLQRDGQDWSLIVPLAKPLKTAVDSANVRRVLDRLRELQATRIVALAEQLPQQYVQVDEHILVALLTERQLPATQTAPATEPAEPQVVMETRVLRVIKVLGKVFAHLQGREVVAVGECPQGLFDDLVAELRDRTILAIEPEQVRRVKILAGAARLELARTGEKPEQKWQNVADPYVRIDSDKVSSYLKDIRNLKAARFVSHAAADREASRFELAKPWLVFELTANDGETSRITLSATGLQPGSHYAAAAGIEGVFLLSAETADKLAKQLQDFIQP